MTDELQPTSLSAAFETWFRQSGVDFWSECDAPDELARIAEREIERLRTREAHLLDVIRHYNPDDALFDDEKVQHA